MATERPATVSCHLCFTPSVAICVPCNRHFCWNHFCEHRRTYEKYVDGARNHEQSLTECLVEFEPIESKLRSSIDDWEHETIEAVHQSANRSRSTLEIHIEKYRSRFEEESSSVTNSVSTNRDAELIQLETLQIEYGHSLENIRLVRRYDREPMLDIETKIPTREEMSLYGSSHIGPHESDNYVPQTALGKRFNRAPLATTSVGSYWAMGGSKEHLLVQEYETKKLTLFDRYGTKGISMTWHFDVAIRDIQWYQDLRRFFLLLDRKLILFDPITRHFEEITQITPYQSSAFRRCTCLNDHLFIAYWGMEGIIELIQISSWSSQQRWWNPVTCCPNELITCIRLSSNDQLALSIQDENNPLNREFRFELRDITLNVLHRIALYSDSGIFSRMTPLPDSHWALLNVDNNLIFIVDERGELIDKIEYRHRPLYNIALIGDDIIVIRATDKLFFYDVEFHEERTRQ